MGIKICLGNNKNINRLPSSEFIPPLRNGCHGISAPDPKHFSLAKRMDSARPIREHVQRSVKIAFVYLRR